MNKDFLEIKGIEKKKHNKEYKDLAILCSIFPNDKRKLVDKHQNVKCIWNR